MVTIPAPASARRSPSVRSSSRISRGTAGSTLGVPKAPAAAWNPIGGFTDGTGRLIWHARRSGAVPRSLRRAVEPEPHRRGDQGGVAASGCGVSWCRGAVAPPPGLAAPTRSQRPADLSSCASKAARRRWATTLRVTEGDHVRLRWTADAPTVLHLHGYDIEQAVAPGQVQSSIRGVRTGRFPVEVQGSIIPVTRAPVWSWRSIRAEGARGVEDEVGEGDRRLLGGAAMLGQGARPAPTPSASATTCRCRSASTCGRRGRGRLLLRRDRDLLSRHRLDARLSAPEPAAPSAGASAAQPDLLFLLKLAAVLLFALVVAAGLFGNQQPLRNIAPTVVWAVVLGRARCGLGVRRRPWAAINPWRSLFAWAEALWRASPAAARSRRPALSRRARRLAGGRAAAGVRLAGAGVPGAGAAGQHRTDGGRLFGASPGPGCCCSAARGGSGRVSSSRCSSASWPASRR